MQRSVCANQLKDMLWKAINEDNAIADKAE